ncbi:L-seryl-tRNA(Sec) selenium transferase [Lacrimispora algidixylanolytica]|uniref:L-seryl-tRNA(Sec) selenium transferase n=1 Tax=Lacrimispora algidixylanolytica TaxID=94868 RepID=A0A419SVP8_9FIRM|nr:L-seryl-tRNA(Sec) selenium transferase [Lacrimispora algidixylanolytica]RKD29290.1 L-seryl-tRNA(Sec) selenium transferase [Lacrimispora algidixylanolytica]
MTDKNSLMRQLPKVDEIIRCIIIERAVKAPEVLIKLAVKKEIDAEREKILAGESTGCTREALLERIEGEIKRQNRPHLKRVINATGIVLHTNLGRAMLANQVSDQMKDIGAYYSNLEYDLEAGERGSRYSHVEQLLTFLTGAEAALVVNNNAAAVFLILNSLVREKEVIVSRGELVEIGGSFRVPEIMKASGCNLVEVGTTNKTHESDFLDGISENTGALLKVHTSNYKIIGFTEEVSVERLKAIGIRHQLPVIYDLGSGLLIDLQAYGIGEEPTVKKCLEDGADVVCFSGDKLLGGPQAGIIVGSKEYISKMKKNHLLRALRIDKLTLTALELTLREYLDEAAAMERIPTLNMIMQPLELLEKRAQFFLQSLDECPEAEYEVVETQGQIGGGSMPGVSLSSYAVCVCRNDISEGMLEQMLRENSTPIVTRIWKNKVLFDVRTMNEVEIQTAADFLNQL